MPGNIYVSKAFGGTAINLLPTPQRWLGTVLAPYETHTATDRERAYLNAMGAATSVGGFLGDIGLGDVLPVAVEGIQAASKGFAGASVAGGLVGDAGLAALNVETISPPPAEEVGMWDWLSSAWGGVSDFFSEGSSLVDEGGDAGMFGDIDISGGIEIGQQVFGALGGDAPSSGGPSASGAGSRVITYGGDRMEEPTEVLAGGMGGALAGGAIWLGSALARAFGSGAASMIYRGANGVVVRMAQLWPLVRKYGPQTVASGLGITAGALGVLLSRPEAIHGRGRKGRGRGISARDVKTTRRTLKSIRKLYHMMPTRRVTSYGGGGYSRRGRHAHYFR